MYDGDTTSTAGSVAMGGPVVIGKWTHLTGVYDAEEKTASLYVNGQLASRVSHTPVWSADGPLTIGATQWDGGLSQPWQGQITNVRVWQRVVVPDDLWGTEADPAAGTQDIPGILAPVRVGSWNFADTAGCYCGEALDRSRWERTLYLHGWDAVPATSGFTSDAHDGDEAAWFNHVQPDGSGAVGDGYGYTQGPVVRPDQSLTVSAWVRLNALNGQEQVIMRQGSGYQALKLYARDDGYWQFAIVSPDPAGGELWSTAYSDAPAALNEWVHLVGVFDAVAGEVRLYVNGVQQAAIGTGATGGMSQEPMYIGAADPTWGYLSGDIDQVKVFVGAMSDRQVKNLYDNS